MTAIPRPSSGEGRRNRSRALSQYPTATDGPTRWNSLESPIWSISRWRRGRSLPSPTRTKRASCTFARTFRATRTNADRFFSADIRPTQPTTGAYGCIPSSLRAAALSACACRCSVRTALYMTAESTVPARTRRSATSSAAWEQAAYAVAVLAVTVSIHARYMRRQGTRLPGSDMW
jgi:hypothetical protein